jgi:hypothetical protein
VRWGIGIATWLVLAAWAPLHVLETWYGVVALAVVIALCVEGLRRRCLADRAEADTATVATPADDLAEVPADDAADVTASTAS